MQQKLSLAYFFSFVFAVLGEFLKNFWKKTIFFKSLPIPVAMCKRYRQS